MPVMDLSSVVLDFADDYVVTRRGPTMYGSDGKADAPSSTTLTVKAVVHPANGRDLQRLPEGARADETIAVFTVAELKTAATANEPDLISVGGRSFEIVHVEPWDVLGNFFRCLAMRLP